MSNQIDKYDIIIKLYEDNKMLNKAEMAEKPLDYVKASYILKNFGINSDRLKKWREGKGLVKGMTLRTYKVNNFYLYCLEDVEAMINCHKNFNSMIYGNK